MGKAGCIAVAIVVCVPVRLVDDSIAVVVDLISTDLGLGLSGEHARRCSTVTSVASTASLTARTHGMLKRFRAWPSAFVN